MLRKNFYIDESSEMILKKLSQLLKISESQVVRLSLLHFNKYVEQKKKGVKK